MEYFLTCTSTCDLNEEILNSRDIKYACFKFIINSKEYDDNFFKDYPYEKFYEDLKKGIEPTTSQVGYGTYVEFFENLLKQNKDVLHICLSSGLSGDYQTAKMVAEELNEKYENKIHVIDSLGASAGYGMLVIQADDNRKSGMSIIDNVKWLEDNKLKIHHLFISTDLTSYVRGGRISKAAGLVGGALKICPLMNMTSEGTLNPIEKIRTETKAQRAQVDTMKQLCDDGINYSNYCWISTSNYEEQAIKLANMIKEEFKNIKDIPIYKVGTTIGSHTGNGTIALYYVGKKR